MHVASHALQGCGSDDAFGSAADAKEDVSPRFGPSRRERACHIAVGDETDASSSRAHFLNDVGVAGAIQDDGGDVADGFAQSISHSAEIFSGGEVEVYGASGIRPNGDLVHIHAGAGLIHGVSVGHRYHSQSVASAVGGELRAVYRVYRNVAARRGAVADALAVVEHRGFVFFAFAYHHDAVHRHGVQHGAHGIHGCGIHGVVVAPPHQSRRCEGGGFGHSHEFQSEVALKREVAGRVVFGHLSARLVSLMVFVAGFWLKVLRLAFG